MEVINELLSKFREKWLIEKEILFSNIDLPIELVDIIVDYSDIEEIDKIFANIGKLRCHPLLGNFWFFEMGFDFCILVGKTGNGCISCSYKIYEKIDAYISYDYSKPLHNKMYRDFKMKIEIELFSMIIDDFIQIMKDLFFEK
jgi:hypothetical protein